MLNWYGATRHALAPHWIMSGGSIEKLRDVLGHRSVVVTERYAHLRPDVFTDGDRALVPVDLTPGRLVRRTPAIRLWRP